MNKKHVCLKTCVFALFLLASFTISLADTGIGQKESRQFPHRECTVLKTISLPFDKNETPVPAKISDTIKPDSILPKVDIVIITYTIQESEALSKVFTGNEDVRKSWHYYTHDYNKFVPLCRNGSNAIRNHRLGSYYLVSLNNKKILLFKSELHLARDFEKDAQGNMTMPIKELFRQIILETKTDLIITTGTAGGVSCETNLGDVVISRAAKFHTSRAFESYNDKKIYKSKWDVPKSYRAKAEKYMRQFAKELQAQAPPSRECSCNEHPLNPRIYFDGDTGIANYKPILTTDFFEFGTSENGLDKEGMACEMDDAVLGLLCDELQKAPHWLCVRNLSDPTINGQLDEDDQKDCAHFYYCTYDCWTTVNSAFAIWGIIMGL